MNAVWFFIGFAAACVVMIVVLTVLIRKMEKAIRQDYKDEWDDENEKEGQTCELCEHERVASNMPPCDMCKHNYPEHFKPKKEE